MCAKQKTRILIADDHQIVIEGIEHMLLAEADVDVVGTAHHGGEVLAFLLEHDADIILMDISMPVMNGIDTCAKVKSTHPQVQVIALTMMQEASLIQRMLKAGASGYLMKNSGKEELLQCIHAVVEGKTYYADEVKEVLLSDLTTPTTKTPFPQLSRREKQILSMIANELTTGEISEQLHISFGTVETHRRNIMQKLGARNTAGMIRMAVEHSLI
jgi:DNA-binding NarL/FixJ family response regulator